MNPSSNLPPPPGQWAGNAFSWADPCPGTVIRVLFRDATDNNGEWADVVQRQPRIDAADGLFCETIETKRAFWFSPSAMERGGDGTVLSYESPGEPDEVQQFRRAEVERLHRTLTRNGTALTPLDGNIQRIENYVTRPSQIRVKAVVLDLDATLDARSQIERAVESMMATGASSEEVRRFRLRQRTFSAAVDLCHFLRYLQSQQQMDRDALLRRLVGADAPEELMNFDEYQLFAEFSCGCKNWKSALAWGVYDDRGAANCDCLNAPLPGRTYVTADDIRRYGCVHMFRNRLHCEETDLANVRDVTLGLETLSDVVRQAPETGEPREVAGNIGVTVSQVRRQQRAWRPRPDAGPPQQACSNCREFRDAIFCQARPVQIESGHMPEYCPKCIRTNRWCRGSLHKSDIVCRFGIVASLLDNTVRWSRSEAGVETVITHEGQRVLVQLKPWLFIVPTHRSTLYSTTGQEENLLRGDRLPAGADELKMFKRMIQHVMMSRNPAIGLVGGVPCAWPTPPDNQVFHELLVRFQAEQAHRGAVPRPISMSDTSNIRAALSQRSQVGLTDSLRNVLEFPNATGVSTEALSEQFKAFLRLRQLQTDDGARNMGAASAARASSSSDAPVTVAQDAGRRHDTSPTSRIRPNGTTADDPGGRSDDSAEARMIEAFALASQSMGGRLLGPWRAFSLGGRRDYGERHGVWYYKPRGWIKRRVRVEDYNRVRDWPIAYHGSSDASIAKILVTSIRRPGDGDVRVAHGQAGGTGQTMYFSKSIYLSSHPVYAPLIVIVPGRRWFQVVLQCKLRPGSWRARTNTLGTRHWPRDVCFDPNLSTNNDMEFLIENPEDCVVIGLMYRELGCDADPALFGELITQIPRDAEEPEYRWTELLSADHRARGFLVAASAGGA
eukprot:TRINITY_DN40587_c0_g1_i1.p1 TRINITY_DN40587_c0_g1~~TRINITY_DN40587_c0_g1_i1.p1  ORF type:complete len:897 (-),score=53.29 TRINITY_DN40587_c0_g1_i1:88-2778(-)